MIKTKKEKMKLVLCVRKMKISGFYKPYAIVPPTKLVEERIKIKKGTPL